MKMKTLLLKTIINNDDERHYTVDDDNDAFHLNWCYVLLTAGSVCCAYVLPLTTRLSYMMFP